jgi:ribosomal protein S18 acetylase RimI-like enzyme
VRDLRLRALADAPDAFGSTYEREAAFADDVWIERAGNADNATYVCAHDGHACGMVTMMRHESDPPAGGLVGMWVDPASRGTGAADLLVTSAVEWAANHGMPSVFLHVAEGNERAERLYCRHGFVRTGASFANGRPGLVEIEMRRPGI